MGERDLYLGEKVQVPDSALKSVPMFLLISKKAFVKRDVCLR